MRAAENVLDLVNARRGHFVYESGHHGGLWLDLDRLFLSPKALAPFVRELAQRLAPHGAQAIVGPLAGGAFLAQMVAAELGVDFVYSEPHATAPADGLYPVAYRLPDSLGSHLSGKRVAIVDDAINAGSAVRGTHRALTQAGAAPSAVGALIVLGEAARQFAEANGMGLEGLTLLANPLWTPGGCPLCAHGVALDEAG